MGKIYQPRTDSTICIYSHLKDSSDLVRIWTHGEDKMLFTGRVRIEREERFSLKQGEETTLVVEPVRKEDAGRYPDFSTNIKMIGKIIVFKIRFTCRIMVKDEVILSHEVNVVDAFTVQPVFDF